MATAQEYAAWLRRNSDKKNSEDYRTVLRAFQEASLEELRTREPEVAEKEGESGFIPAARAGFESLKGEAALTAGKLGLMGLKEAEAYRVEREKEAKRIFKPTEEGWTESPFAKIKELAGGAVPYMLAPIAAGVGVAATPLTGTAAVISAGLAAGAASAAQFTGSNLARQIEEAEARGEDASLERAKLGNAFAAAVPQAALDVVSLRGIPLIRNLFKSVGKDLTEAQAKALIEQSFKQKLADYGRTTLLTSGREGFTEVGQQYLERLQAGLEVTDPSARAEYLDSFIGGAVLGGVLAPAGRFIERGGEQGRARQKLSDVESEQRKVALEEEQRLEAAEAEKRKQPEYLRDLQSRYDAIKEKDAKYKEDIKALEAQKGDPAAQAEAKELRREYADFMRGERSEVVKEYNKAGGAKFFQQFAERERVAKLSPEDYMLEQFEAEASAARDAEYTQLKARLKSVERNSDEAKRIKARMAQLKPPAKTAAQEAADIEAEIMGLEPLGPADIERAELNKYASGQLELAKQAIDSGMATGQDIPSYLVQDPAFALKLVQSNAQLPGMSRPQSNLILNKMRELLQDIGSDIGASRESAVAQREALEKKLQAEREALARIAKSPEYVQGAMRERREYDATTERINRLNDQLRGLQTQRLLDFEGAAPKEAANIEAFNKAQADLATQMGMEPPTEMAREPSGAVQRIYAPEQLGTLIERAKGDTRLSEEDQALLDEIDANLPNIAKDQGFVPEAPQYAGAPVTYRAPAKSELRAVPAARNVADWLYGLSTGRADPELAQSIRADLRKYEQARRSETEQKTGFAVQELTPDQQAAVAGTTLKGRTDFLGREATGEVSRAQQAALFTDEAVEGKIFDSFADFDKYLASKALDDIRKEMGLVEETASRLNKRLQFLEARVAPLRKQIAQVQEQRGKLRDAAAGDKAAAESLLETAEKRLADELKMLDGIFADTVAARDKALQQLQDAQKARTDIIKQIAGNAAALERQIAEVETANERVGVDAEGRVVRPDEAGNLDMTRVVRMVPAGQVAGMQGVRKAQLELQNAAQAFLAAEEKLTQVIQKNKDADYSEGSSALRELISARAASKEAQRAAIAAHYRLMLAHRAVPALPKLSDADFRKFLMADAQLADMLVTATRRVNAYKGRYDRARNQLNEAYTYVLNQPAGLATTTELNNLRNELLLAKEMLAEVADAPARAQIAELPLRQQLAALEQEVGNLEQRRLALRDRQRALPRRPEETQADRETKDAAKRKEDQAKLERAEEPRRPPTEEEEREGKPGAPIPRTLVSFEQRRAQERKVATSGVVANINKQINELSALLSDEARLIAEEEQAPLEATKAKEQQRERTKRRVTKFSSLYIGEYMTPEQIAKELEPRFKKVADEFNANVRSKLLTDAERAEAYKKLAELRKQLDDALKASREYYAGVGSVLGETQAKINKLKEELDGDLLNKKEQAQVAAALKRGGEDAAKAKREELEAPKRTSKTARLTELVEEQNARVAKFQKSGIGSKLIRLETKAEKAEARKKLERELGTAIMTEETAQELADLQRGQSEKRAIGPVTRPEVYAPETMRTGSAESREGKTTGRAEKSTLKEARGVPERDVRVGKREQKEANELAEKMRAGVAKPEVAAPTKTEQAAEKELEAQEVEVETALKKGRAKVKEGKRSVTATIEDIEAELDAFEPEILPGINEDIYLSRGRTPSPSTVDGVRAELSKVFSDIGRVQVYSSVDALIAANPEYEGRVPSDARGFVDPTDNRAFLIAGNINKGQALSVLLHEVGAHIGLKRLLGEAQYNALVNVVKAWEKLNNGSLESQVARAARERVTSAKTKAEQVNDELLAYAIEEAANAGVKPMETKSILGRWMSQIAALFNKTLQAFGLKTKQMTAQELVDMAFGAAKIEMKDASGVKTRVTEAPAAPETELLFSRKPAYAAGLANAGRIADQTVSQRPGFFAKMKENMLGMGFRTQFVDALAPLEKVAGQVSDAVKGVQMMYYLRMYGQRMNLTSLSLSDGVPQLVEKKRKDGTSEWVIESVPGVNVSKIVERLSKKAVIQAAGSADAANRLFTLYLAKLRADNKGYDALNFGRASAELELKQIERDLASGKLSNDDKARLRQRQAHLTKIKDSLPTEADIKTAFAEIQANPVLREAFADAREMYNEYNQNLLRFMVQTGAMSKEEAQRLLKEKDYVPYYRVRDGVAQLMIGGETPVRVGNLKDSPHLQELVGGEEPIFSFLDSSVQNTSMLIDMAMRNIAVKNAMWEMGKLGYAKVKKAGKGGAPKGAVEFKQDGEDYYAIVDTDHIGIPSELLTKGLAGIPTMFPAAVQVMGIPARFLRRAVTASPVYAFRQLMRDSLSSFIASGADTAPVVSALKQLGRASAVDRRGITGGQVFTGMPEDMSRLLADMQAGRSGWAKAFAKMEAFSMEVDAANRRSQYESYLKQGLSEMEATMLALESMNFTRRGLSPSVQMITALIPFMNAQIQSLDVLYRSLRGQMPFNERLAIREKLITRGLMLAGMTMAYALAMQDDEDYQNATPDQKYNNWFVPIPGFEEKLRVPIPFELGYIFKALPEAIINSMYAKRGADEAQDAALNILRNLIPGGSNFGVPQAFKPLIEVGLGKSFFTGRDIETGAEKMQEPWSRYRDNTSEIAKAVGQMFNISPIKIETLVSGYTGSMGLALMQAANLVLPGPETAKAEKRMSEMPVIGSAFQPKDAAGIINDTFDRFKEITEAKATYDKLIERGELQKADAFLSQNADRMALSSLAGDFRQRIGEITTAERQIRGADMSPQEKREVLDALRQSKILLASSVRAALDTAARP
jgi:hypothetical protein